MAKFVEIEGVKFYPLSFDQIEALGDDLLVFRDIDARNLFGSESGNKLLNVFLKSATRYSDQACTMQQLKRIVDLENLKDITGAVLGQGGFKQITLEEASAPTSPRIGG
jgi:hypothetical protein